MNEQQSDQASKPMLALSGELTIGCAQERKAEVLDGLARFPRQLDLRAVTQIDGAGLQLLLLARRESDRQPFPFDAVLPSPCVVAALALARLGLDLRPTSSPSVGMVDA